jgi:hypothetical protein
MSALNASLGTVLALSAIVFGALNALVFYRLLFVTRGLRRILSALVLFISVYAVVVYSLSFAGLLPDGAEYLSFLLRPVVVGLLGFLAAYGILDRRH